MPEYIDKEKYCAEVGRCNKEKCDKSKCPIWNAPAADVAPVVHGKWILDAKNHCHCSRCLYGRNIEMQIGWNYCPACGAEMDLEES